MTYIELFDEDALENICACLANNPCRVVLLGDNHKLLDKHAKCYQAILNNRGSEAEFVCKTVNKNSLGDIIRVISEIAEQYDDCVFELTGGGDLYLVAIGIVMERYRAKKFKTQRFNLRNGVLYEFDDEYEQEKKKQPILLSVKENIQLYGGDIICGEGGKTTTHQWDMTDDFLRDVDLMWELCKDNLSSWNTQIGILAAVNNMNIGSEDPLYIRANTEEIKNLLGEKSIPNQKLLKSFQKEGLFTSLTFDKAGFQATYKNLQVKECLSKAGQVLEMKVFAAGLQAVDTKGNRIYNDVENGVWIDWDGEMDGENYGTSNEIDVLLMCGTVPVFVSCKNGVVGTEELYKLEAVAEKFGGKYAKKVLIATQLKDNKGKQMLLQRAKDMDIRVIDDIRYMNDKELMRTIGTLWV